MIKSQIRTVIALVSSSLATIHKQEEKEEMEVIVNYVIIKENGLKQLESYKKIIVIKKLLHYESWQPVADEGAGGGGAGEGNDVIDVSLKKR